MRVSIDAADGQDPHEALRVAAEARRKAERQQDAAVRRARVAGLSWAEIATHLGVSKQAAHRKYRGRLPGRA
jgi:DNA-directed RNA polymerase specialized sigma24 family protein